MFKMKRIVLVNSHSVILNLTDTRRLKGQLSEMDRKNKVLLIPGVDSRRDIGGGEVVLYLYDTIPVP